jgi:hypothetical protein
MLFRKSLFLLAAAVSAYGQTVPSDSDRPVVKRQPPIDLQGLWQVLDPKTGRALANYNISQNGTAFTMRFLPPGRPEAVSYEGTLQGALVTGKMRDFRSTEPLWLPLQIRIVDHDHLKDSLGTELTRATAAETASFREYRNFSFLSLPAGKFDLNGIWGGFGPGVQIAIWEKDGTLTMTEIRRGDPAFFHGIYFENPVITGQRGMWSPVTREAQWNESAISIISPDHLDFENKVLYRVSNPASHDLACDEQNSNLVRDYYAWLRGAIASSEGDHKSAKCWLTIGASFEFAPALSMLSALLLQDSSPDYPRAFDLASRGAAQGDVITELKRQGVTIK